MTAMHHGLTRLDQLTKTCLEGRGPAKPFAQTMGRLKPPNPVHIKNITHTDVIKALDDLSQTMRATKNEDGHADAGMTFFGQFVDHDITLDVTSALGSRIDPATIPNVRTPSLDLDCVYGNGPEASPYLYGKGDQDHMLVFGRDDNPLDLARTCAGKALIGDFRNDENVIVAQVQGIFIQLHNILMSKLSDGSAEAGDVKACAHEGISDQVWKDHVAPGLTSFQEVRRFIRLHYQWIVWNELCGAFVDSDCLERAMQENLFGWDAPVIPVEFSGACYRFGHATTQFSYQFKENEGSVGLFETRGFGPRPTSANLDMNLFFSMKGDTKAQKARPVGPGLGDPLFDLPFVNSKIALPDIGEEMSLPQSRNLALRNMIRDRYTYQLASGQHFAAHLGTKAVPIPEPLAKKGFKKTPLWFYALQEAEKHGDGKLTGVGGLIVASVFANLLKRDPTTYVHIPHFKPWPGFSGEHSCLAGIIAYVEKHREHIKNPEGLMCGPKGD